MDPSLDKLVVGENVFFNAGFQTFYADQPKMNQLVISKQFTFTLANAASALALAIPFLFLTTLI